MNSDISLQVTGFGYAPIFKNFEEWVEEDIQDWEAAINVADSMLAAYPMSYPYNEEYPGGAYQEFDICNLEAFKIQLEEARNAENSD